MRDNRDIVESAVSRRVFLTAAGQVALAAGVGRFLPRMVAGHLITEASGQASVSGQSSRLIIRSENPQDFETPIELLNTWITPNDLFYVRSHLYTPKVDAKEWRLQVDGAVQQQMTLTMEDLKRFPDSNQLVTLESSRTARAFYHPPLPPP